MRLQICFVVVTCVALLAGTLHFFLLLPSLQFGRTSYLPCTPFDLANYATEGESEIVVTQRINQLIEDYQAFHACSIKTMLGMSHANFVVYEAVDGLGNRMRGLSSAFLVALMTGRVLLVDWNADEASYASLSDLVVAPVDWESRGVHDVAIRAVVQRLWSALRNRQVGSEFSFLPHSSLLCYDFRSVSTRVIWLRTNQYLVPHLLGNPHHASLLEAVFHGHYFNAVFDHLFVPSEAVIAHMEDIVPPSEIPSLHWGLHLRVPTYEVRDNKSILVYIDGVKVALREEEKEEKEEKEGQHSGGLFIAADSEENAERLATELTRVSPELAGRIYIDRTVVDRKSVTGVQRAFAGMLLLRQCHHLVVSTNIQLQRTSSFGMLSHSGMQEDGYWMVNLGGGEPGVFKVASSEPDRFEPNATFRLCSLCQPELLAPDSMQCKDPDFLNAFSLAQISPRSAES